MKFKLKYKDGATKKICILLALAARKKFSKLLREGRLIIPINISKPDFDVISFSGGRDFEEQALSIYSFLFHIGVPVKWIIYSDGSYKDNEMACLLKVFPFLQFKEWNHNKSLDKNQLLQRYLSTCHLSKKLHAILGHSYERQTIYADSDIVFYKNSSLYFNSGILKKGFWYVPDTNWGSLSSDNGDCSEEMFALNSGLLILNENFNFGDVFEYLEGLNFNFEYFSEQSSFNYSFKKQKANVLDPRQFIIDTKDQFDFNTKFRANEIALRHYVTPVRHKMWQQGWKWHFQN